MAERKKIDFNFKSPETLTSYFDEEKLETIINNLLSNAFKFSPNGGYIEMAIINLSNERPGKLKITISNTGSYIPENNINKIFDRFSQIKNKN